MPDWTRSMKQTFEYYVVDPGTWQETEMLTTVKSSTISRDSSSETLGSATFDVTDVVGECYIRVYLITVQDNITEKFPLGTFLVQTPSSSFDGKIRSVSMDAYTPLLELKESPPPLGYYLPIGDNIMQQGFLLTREHLRAPVVETKSQKTLYKNFVANTDDTWLTFISDLVTNAKYYIDLDEMGRVIFSPRQETDSLRPVWTYADDNSSILSADVSMEHDLYGIPNVVEVVYSRNYLDPLYTKVINDDPNSPTSIANRGREIIYRVTDPELEGDPTRSMVEEYANNLLKELSSVSYSVTYTHGYCPVRLGDCILLNYERAGITNVKARVVSQSIKCEAGCQVTEKAVFVAKLWGGETV